jgi:hypothetical protein
MRIIFEVYVVRKESRKEISKLCNYFFFLRRRPEEHQHTNCFPKVSNKDGKGKGRSKQASFSELIAPANRTNADNKHIIIDYSKC